MAFLTCHGGGAAAGDTTSVCPWQSFCFSCLVLFSYRLHPTLRCVGLRWAAWWRHMFIHATMQGRGPPREAPRPVVKTRLPVSFGKLALTTVISLLHFPLSLTTTRTPRSLICLFPSHGRSSPTYFRVFLYL